jgi:hypothetical protein
VTDPKNLESEATELLRTLIRNACVNDGTPASGHEERNADALEAYFAGSGLAFGESLRLSATMWKALCRDFLA